MNILDALHRAKLSMMLLLLFSLLTLPTPRPLHAQDEPINLIPNPGFETESDPWEGCGDVAQVDSEAAGVTGAMVHSGRYAARIRYNTDQPTCGAAIFDPVAQLSQSFTVPADAQDLTVSFWYSRIDDTLFPLQVYLGTSTSDVELDVMLANVEPEELPGWNFYRTELNLPELEQVRGQTINLFFSMFTISQQAAIPDDALNRAQFVADGTYYIDDVRVTTSIERTTAAPLPADLQGDAARPLVYLTGEGIARMNPDSSASQVIYKGTTSPPLNPVWSSNGTQIAVLEHALNPPNSTDPNVIPAFLTVLYVIDAGGGNVREIYRTNGMPGRRATPVDNEIPALDVQIRSMDWSPDDRTLAITICSSNRYSNGSSTDEICKVELVDIASGDSIRTLERAFRASWSRDNRLLFENTIPTAARADGIWEVDLNSDPPTEARLLPGTGDPPFPSPQTENWPVWSPDGSKFATVRDVAGYHYTPEGVRVFHDAIMVFDRATLVGESVLLVDHGTEPAGLTWSPDGKYLLYNLTNGNAVDIWWLEVATGATGQVTTNGASIAADWRPACVGDACAPGGTVKLLLPLIKP